MIKKTIKRFLMALALMLVSIVSYAQITTSSVSGKVTDEVEPLVGVAVIAQHLPSGTQYYASTNTEGRYSILAMRPGGPYKITFELVGFKKTEVTEVYLSLDNLELNQKMVIDTQNLEEVVIVAKAANKSLKTGAGTSISRETFETMPTSTSRSLNDVLKLTPQASTTTSGLAVGGGNYRSSYVTVDGAAFNNAFGIGQNLPAGGSPISLDAIEQISVNITPYDVRHSGFQGGAINAVTKSGTNDWHASAYNYYTSDKVRGKKVEGTAIPVSESLNNTVGVSLGGPIVKNKLFFFVNGEYTFDKVPGSSRLARTDVSQPFGEDEIYNRPLASELDNIKTFLADKYGYDPGRYQGYSLSTPDYKVMARLDWNINKNNTLNIRFSHTHTSGSNQPSSSMSPIGGTNSSFIGPNGENIYYNRYSAGRQSTYAMYFESSRYFQEQNFTSVAGELNSRFANQKGNNLLRLTWSHQNEPRSYVGDFFPTVDILSNKEVTGTDTYANFTTFGVDPFTYGNIRDVQIVNATDEISYIAGIHNLVAGAQFEWNRSVNGFMQGGAGWFIYDSWDSFVADANNKSVAPVAFMITHANLDDPTQQTFPAFDYTQYSVYAQDEINFSNYFKVTAGVRLELPFITIPTDNENKDFTNVANANPTSSFAGLSTADVPKARVSVSPRVGFNWDVLKDRSLVIRGGTGIFNGRIPNVWLVSAIGNSNVLQYQYIANAKTGNPVVHFNNDRAEVINSIYSSGKFVKQDLAAPTATTIIAKDLKMPSSWKSSFGIDAKLPGDVKLTLEGVYSYNLDEVYATSLGYAKTSTVQLPGEPKPRNVWTSEGIKNMAGSTMNGYYIHNVSDIHGKYYSLTAQLAKDFDFGLSMMAAYTYSDAYSVSDGNGDQISEFANTYQINGCNEPVLGHANYVSPHRVIGNIGYTINEGKNLATKLGIFYEGYNVGFYSSYSYSRMSYLMNNVSGAGTASQLIYIPTNGELEAMPFVSEQNKADYANFLATDAYTSKHIGEYSERNGVKAPWLNRINARVAQDVSFNIAGKKQTIEIGADFNNVANMLNSAWGCYKSLSSNTILSYKNGVYTFTEPVWKTNSSLNSTWSILLGVRYSF